MRSVASAMECLNAKTLTILEFAKNSKTTKNASKTPIATQIFATMLIRKKITDTAAAWRSPNSMKTRCMELENMLVSRAILTFNAFRKTALTKSANTPKQEPFVSTTVQMITTDARTSILT